MAKTNSNVISHENMSDKLFNKLAESITLNLGIRMPLEKKQMLEARISRRLRKLNLSSYDDYYKYLFGKDEQLHQGELQNFYNAVTTNKTDFFREPQHFEYLSKIVIPAIVSQKKTLGRIPEIKLWCAGSSSGEEAYTLAVVLSEYAKNNKIHFSIIASDISTKVLKKSMLGIYPEGKLSNFTMSMKKEYLLRSKDRENKQVRFVKEIRDKIQHTYLNFMDESYDVIPNNIDIIFFRNVMIYFNLDVQLQVLQNILPKLRKDGFLFTGHAETLNNLQTCLERKSVAVYKKL